jgi:dTMP kinase
MDVPASIGLSRLHSQDRLESEPLAFHERVRQEFLNIAKVDPERYFVVDATQAKEEIAQQIQERVSKLPLLAINKDKKSSKK